MESWQFYFESKKHLFILKAALLLETAYICLSEVTHRSVLQNTQREKEKVDAMIRNREDEEEGKSLIQRMGYKFLYGFSVYVGQWILRFPARLPQVLYAICAFGITVKIALNFNNLALIIDCAHMMIHMIVGFIATTIGTKQRGRVLRLSNLLDQFDTDPELEVEGQKIKADCEERMQGMYDTFSRCILVTINVYILFPVSKLLTETGRSNLSKILVWQMWMWVAEDTWWGFSIVFLFELATSLFLLLSVMYTVPYLACLGIMTVGHCRLLIVSLELLDKSATKRSEVKSISFEAALNQEIDNCARRLHHTYRLANEVAEVYELYLSGLYYGGGLVLCMSGLLTVSANGSLEETLKFMGILTGELVTCGLVTYVSEGIIQGFADIKVAIYNVPWYNYPKLSSKRLHLMTTLCSFRGLRAKFGYELTLEHFGDVLNASYKYYNLLLLTMK